MAVFIDTITFKNNYDGVVSSATSFVGNKYCSVTVNVQGFIHLSVDATTDNEVSFAPDGLTELSYIQMVNGGGDFSEFQAGDTINVTASTSNNGSYTVLEKIDDSTIRVNASLTNETSSAAYVRAFRTYTTGEYKYGLSENEDQNNYISKVDGSIQRFFFSGITPPTSSIGVPIGINKSWLTSSDEVYIVLGVPNTTIGSNLYGKQTFEINHTFYFLPFLPHSNSLAIPSYFLDDRCLKYEFNILLKQTENSLSNFQELSHSETLGNSGFLDERLNTGQTNYSIDSVVYTKVSDSSVVDAVQLTDSDGTRVTIRIENTVDTPFTTNTIGFVWLHYVPQNESEYKLLPTYLEYNLYADTAIAANGSGAASSAFSRHISNFTVTNISSSICTFVFDVDLSAGDFAELFSKENPEYVIVVGIQDRSKTILNGDGVTLLADKREFEIQLGLADLTDIADEKFYQHYDEYDNMAHPLFQDTIFFKEDEFGVKRRLKIDISQGQKKDIILKSITAGVRLRNSSNGFSTDLQSYTYDATLDPIQNGLAYIDGIVQTSYKVDDGDKLREFKIIRRLDLDATDNWFYDLEIPIMVRWEFWEANNIIPNELFDNTLPLGNKNDNWDEKDTAGYEITVFTRAIIEVAGVNYASENDTVINILNYDEGTDFTPFEFELFDLDNNPLPAGLMYTYENIRVKATTEYIGSGTIPLEEETELVLRIEQTQNGGHYVSRRYSTALATQDTWFEAIAPLTTKAKKTKTGNFYSIEAIVTAADLPDFSSFDFTARIYNLLVGIPVGAKLLENGNIKLMESGSIKIMD